MALLDPSIWTDKIYVNGWREGGAGSADAVEPATGKTLGSYGVASVEDVLEAARTAAAAQKEWAARKPEERAAVLRRAGASGKSMPKNSADGSPARQAASRPRQAWKPTAQQTSATTPRPCRPTGR